MKRSAAGLYLAATELVDAIGRGPKKLARAQRALRDQADLFAKSYEDGADNRLKKDERRFQ